MEEFEKEIFRISKDRERANELFEMAAERLDRVIKSLPQDLPYKILEEYYEIAIQLITALMYSEGYKTLSHVALIRFLSKNYKFDEKEFQILESMIKFRHGIVYYGRKNGGNFYINHTEEIKEIINKLLELVKKELKGNE